MTMSFFFPKESRSMYPSHVLPVLKAAPLILSKVSKMQDSRSSIPMQKALAAAANPRVINLSFGFVSLGIDGLCAIFCRLSLIHSPSAMNFGKVDKISSQIPIDSEENELKTEVINFPAIAVKT
jgi:hypothetical protein